MFLIINSIGIIIGAIYLISLIVGLIICRKQLFTEGFYFFLIMIISQVHSFFAPLYTNIVIDHYQKNGASGGLTLGQFVISISYMDTLINSIAFLILVIGFYRRWKRSSDGVNLSNNI